MTKDDVAAALEEIGILLQLQGENDFRVKAYTNAARVISQLEGDFAALVNDGKLASIRGIGKSLQDKITDYVKTGMFTELEDLKAKVPPGLVEMLKLPGIGPKKVIALQHELQIDTIDKLKAACDSDQVAQLKGFGAKTQQKILEGIAFLGTVGQRVRIDMALPLGQRFLEAIRQLPGVIRAELCGSIRRRRETCKDIDLLASAKDAKPIMKAFVEMPEVMQVIGHGDTKSSVVAGMSIDGNKVVLNVDLRIVPDDVFAFGVLHFTGSKDHNIRLRQRAIERELTLSEYGLVDGDGNSVQCDTEEDIYAELDLQWIPPELREDTGEVEAAEKSRLPTLIVHEQLRGVFHNHTTASDGTASLAQMAQKCIDLGWEYYGSGDHSQSLTVANGLSPERVRQQWAEIDQLNASYQGKFRILKGIECDILQDGSLDYDDEFLKGFDYVVASVHTYFNLPEAEQTARVCKALAHPATTMLGHATGRLLLRREGYKIDLEKVIQAAAEHKKMIEINAQPSRLDLDWTYVKRAKALGVMLVINPDAHSPGELELTSYGINVARRGWLNAENVFNTRSLKDVLKYLGKQ